MKIWQAHRLMLLCSVILFMTLVSSTVTAQDELLTNPGFESPFEPVEGVMPGQIAQGWLPWFSTDGGALEPEYYASSDEASGLGSPRIRSGSDAQQYFSFFSTHIAGVYQPVGGIVVGTTVEFSVYSWLWSSNLDDANVSDAEAAITIEVGIDPTGGQDATSAAIVWSAPVSIFDEFFQSSIAAVAQSDIVTVFVRSVITEPLRNSVVYLDDAALVATETVDTAMTAEATAEMPASTEIPVEPTVETVITDESTVELTVEIPATEVPLVEVTLEATDETIATDVPTVEVTLEITPEIVVETATVEATDEIIAVETAPVEVTVEVIETVTPEATAEVTVEIVATEAPTLAATVETIATVVPTVDAPTVVVPATEVPTLEATLVATEVPTIVPSPTLNLTVFPLSVTYIVQNFDIVVDIANRYGTTVDAIIIANGLNENALIFVGQELVIPVQTLPQPTSTPTSTISVQVVPATEVPTMVAEATSSAQISPTATQTVRRYTVQYGDTLSSIAARFGTTTRALARLNRIVNANLVYRGQVLIISGADEVVTPTPTATLSSATATPTMVPPTATQTAYRGTYRIMPGDTLYFISIRFNVRISDLIQINNIVDPNRVYVGQVLNIP